MKKVRKTHKTQKTLKRTRKTRRVRKPLKRTRKTRMVRRVRKTLKRTHLLRGGENKERSQKRIIEGNYLIDINIDYDYPGYEKYNSFNFITDGYNEKTIVFNDKLFPELSFEFEVNFKSVEHPDIVYKSAQDFYYNHTNGIELSDEEKKQKMWCALWYKFQVKEMNDFLIINSLNHELIDGNPEKLRLRDNTLGILLMELRKYKLNNINVQYIIKQDIDDLYYENQNKGTNHIIDIYNDGSMSNIMLSLDNKINSFTEVYRKNYINIKEYILIYLNIKTDSYQKGYMTQLYLNFIKYQIYSCFFYDENNKFDKSLFDIDVFQILKKDNNYNDILQLFSNIKKYINSKGYDIVWFNKDTIFDELKMDPYSLDDKKNILFSIYPMIKNKDFVLIKGKVFLEIE